MYFDRFDICEAWWVYATLWNGSRGADDIFRRLYAIKFVPRPNISKDTLGENGLAILHALEERDE